MTIKVNETALKVFVIGAVVFTIVGTSYAFHVLHYCATHPMPRVEETTCSALKAYIDAGEPPCSIGTGKGGIYWRKTKRDGMRHWDFLYQLFCLSVYGNETNFPDNLSCLGYPIHE